LLSFDLVKDRQTISLQKDHILFSLFFQLQLVKGPDKKSTDSTEKIFPALPVLQIKMTK